VRFAKDDAAEYYRDESTSTSSGEGVGSECTLDWNEDERGKNYLLCDNKKDETGSVDFCFDHNPAPSYALEPKQDVVASESKKSSETNAEGEADDDRNDEAGSVDFYFDHNPNPSYAVEPQQNGVTSETKKVSQDVERELQKNAKENASVDNRKPKSQERTRQSQPSGIKETDLSVHHQSKNLHISNMASGTTQQQLWEHFGQHCKVEAVKIKGEGKYAFVHTTSIQQADNARNVLQGSELNGFNIVINFGTERYKVGNKEQTSSPISDATTPRSIALLTNNHQNKVCSMCLRLFLEVNLKRVGS